MHEKQQQKGYSERNWYRKMQKFFCVCAIMIISVCSLHYAFAQENTGGSTNGGNVSASSQGDGSLGNILHSPDFTIQLSTLDPIQRKTTGENVKPPTYQSGWKGLFQRLAHSITNLLLMVIPLLAGVSLIVAGYFFIFFTADGELVSKGKNIIKYNLIAMVIAFLSYVIISLIAGFFTPLK